MLVDRRPIVATVGRNIDLTTSRAEIYAARVAGVDCHSLAEHVDIAMLLRKAAGQSYSLVSTCPASVHTQLAVYWDMFAVAQDWHHVYGFWLVGVDVDRKSEVAR